jgi:hypothetical protein
VTVSALTSIPPVRPQPVAVTRPAAGDRPARGDARERPEQPATGRPEGQRGVPGGPAARPSDAERQQVQELARRDREVRAHEAAHKAAAGAAARGTPSFDTVRGPDGRQYAVGGELRIDTSPVAGDPEATIAKLRQVERAARAPAEPSAADRRVATEAAASIRDAELEIAAARAAAASEAAGSPARPNGPAGERPAQTPPVGSRIDVVA